MLNLILMLCMWQNPMLILFLFIHSFLGSLNHTLPHIAEDPSSVEYLPWAMPSLSGNLKLSPTLGFPTAHPFTNVISKFQKQYYGANICPWEICTLLELKLQYTPCFFAMLQVGPATMKTFSSVRCNSGTRQHVP